MVFVSLKEMIMSITDLPGGLIGPDDPEFDGPLDTDVAGEGHTPHKRLHLVVIVFAPRDPDPKKFRFRLDEVVGAAAATAAAAFHYAEGGTPSFRMPDGEVLDRTITLEAAGVRNREDLELVEAGGGV